MKLDQFLNYLLGLCLIVSVAVWVNDGVYRGASSYDGSRDTKFYAACAENINSKGTFEWFEIYPCHLREGKEARVAWTAIAHPWLASLFIKAGVNSPFSVVISSMMSYVFLLLALAVSIWSVTKSWHFASLVVVVFSFNQDSFGYATSGGNESLAQVFLVLQLALLTKVWFSSSDKGALPLYVLFAISFLSLFCRPQNTILFLLSVLLIPLHVWFRKENWTWYLKWLCLWMGIFVFHKLCVAMLIHEKSITFGYLVGFLKGTPTYPGYQIVRELFLDGFGVGTLIEQKAVLVEKASLIIGFLKIYWSSWLPESFLLFLLFCLDKKYRALYLLLGLTMAALMVLSAMGYHATRYWLVLQPMTYFLVALSLWAFGARWFEGQGKMMVVLPLFLLGFSFLTRDVHWSGEGWSKDMSSSAIPSKVEGWLHELEPGALIVCQDPPQVIDSIKGRVMRLPQTPELLMEVVQRVEKPDLILIPPTYKSEPWVKTWLQFSSAHPEFMEAYQTLDPVEGWSVWRAKPKG